MSTNYLPIPLPPRTPTPPTPIPEEPDHEHNPFSLDPNSPTRPHPHIVNSTITYSSNSFGSMASPIPSSAGSTPLFGMDGAMESSLGGRGPFNFQPQTIKDGPGVANSVRKLSIPPPLLSHKPFQFAESACDEREEETDGRQLPLQSPTQAQFRPQSPTVLRFLGIHGEGKGTGNSLGQSQLQLQSRQSQSQGLPKLGKSPPKPLQLQSSNYSQFQPGPPQSPLRSQTSPQTPSKLQSPTQFQFQNQSLLTPPQQNIGKRRGHRYKHSSVSAQHQIFMEPPPRAPLALPASLPIPTFLEAWSSRSKEQSGRMIWCLCHFGSALYVLYTSSGSLTLTALSHLLLFDALTTTLTIGSSLLQNFQVYHRTTLRHPFGLQRVEVLSSFAMSVFLLFMAFDLLSHNAKHVLESVGKHEPHHPHSHERVTPGSVDLSALVSIIITLISATVIGKTEKGNRGAGLQISGLPAIFANPAHLLTLTCSTIILILPLLSLPLYLWLDRLLCLIISISMFSIGIRLAISQGLMLLMSYNGKSDSDSDTIESGGVSEVVNQISRLPSVTGVEDARFWQVGFGVCMAALRIRVGGGKGNGYVGGGGSVIGDSELKGLRERVGALVRNGLGDGYGRGGGVRWEVTVEFLMEG